MHTAPSRRDTAVGLMQMAISPAYKACLGACWLYLISSVFTLAKTLRDAHEAQRLEVEMQ